MNEEGPAQDRANLTAAEADATKSSGTDPQCISSRQVAWWPVHEFVAPALTRVRSWPTVGTPEWCALPDDDPAKLAALFDAAQHWALRLDVRQEAHAEASKAVAAALDWPSLARDITQRNDFRAAHPWTKRVTT